MESDLNSRNRLFERKKKCGVVDDVITNHQVDLFKATTMTLGTFTFDCEYDFLALELVMLTTRSSTSLVVNRRTTTRFESRMILRIPIKNLVIPKSRTRNRSRCQICSFLWYFIFRLKIEIAEIFCKTLQRLDNILLWF